MDFNGCIEARSNYQTPFNGRFHEMKWRKIESNHQSENTMANVLLHHHLIACVQLKCYLKLKWKSGDTKCFRLISFTENQFFCICAMYRETGFRFPFTSNRNHIKCYCQPEVQSLVIQLCSFFFAVRSIQVHGKHMWARVHVAQVFRHYKFQSNSKWLCRYTSIHLFNLALREYMYSLQVISSVLNM